VKRLIGRIALYLFHIGFVRPVVFFVLGTRYRRRGLVPSGPCIVVANHNSHLDAALLMTMFPLRRLHRIHPVAAADYFGKNFLLRTLAMALMNGIPIERRPRAGEDPLTPMVSALERGESLVFFPEGSRGEAGVLAKFRPGIGLLVKKFPGLLVVPVFMTGPERIWPRGETVPVPTGIDVQIGKPRTYPSDLDSREIADRVRDAVQSLAPPPQDVPGPRPGPPVRVAVCGLDPDLRAEVVRAVTVRLGRTARTVALANPMLQADTEGVREGGIPPTRSRAWPAFLAWAFRTSGLFKGYKFAEMVERARLDEAFGDGRLARFLVGDGNPLVDVMAWADADFYRGRFDEREAKQVLRYLAGQRRIPFRQWGRFVLEAPELWLLNVFDLARPPVPDVLALLRHDPDDILARRRARGVRLGKHERATFLGELARSYDTVAAALGRRGPTSVVSLDVDGRSAVEELADRVVAAVEDRIAQPPDAAEGS
jgi:1-acyl-sn-glycerol-3-phosphate acyltransferase